MDEATSALDSISENAILVVKDGVIAEQGDHESLLALNGIYKELYETQFRQILDMEGSLEWET